MLTLGWWILIVAIVIVVVLFVLAMLAYPRDNSF